MTIDSLTTVQWWQQLSRKCVQEQQLDTERSVSFLKNEQQQAIPWRLFTQMRHFLQSVGWQKHQTILTLWWQRSTTQFPFNANLLTTAQPLPFIALSSLICLFSLSPFVPPLGLSSRRRCKALRVRAVHNGRCHEQAGQVHADHLDRGERQRTAACQNQHRQDTGQRRGSGTCVCVCVSPLFRLCCLTFTHQGVNTQCRIT